MTVEEKILFTFPGKLGDLVYSLPAVRAAAAYFRRRVFFQTSEFCRPALPLLSSLPFIAGAFLDPDYRLEHARFGVQPYLMSEPPGFSTVFHLGFRPGLLEKSIFSRPLIDSFFFVLKEVYGLELSWGREPYLHLAGPAQGEDIVFQGHGETLRDLMDVASKKRLAEFWPELFRLTGRRVTAVCAPGERDVYRALGMPAVCPANLLQTARLIRKAKVFVGVQSAAAAVADGLAAPRLILAWFGNALPVTANGLTFTLEDDPERAARDLKAKFGV
ncbi:MAG: hypothetical protein V1816_27320 [Pseudomonadota bacterium]